MIKVEECSFYKLIDKHDDKGKFFPWQEYDDKTGFKNYLTSFLQTMKFITSYDETI